MCGRKGLWVGASKGVNGKLPAVWVRMCAEASALAHLGQAKGAGSVAPLQGLVLPVAVLQHFLLQRCPFLDGLLHGREICLTRLFLAALLSEALADLLHQPLVLIKLELQLIHQSLCRGGDKPVLVEKIDGTTLVVLGAYTT